jgi:hypothetical protein
MSNTTESVQGDMSELEEAIIVRFPLDGEWRAMHTPGTKIPSHGSDELGQRYAYDFLRLDPAEKPYNEPNWKYYLLGMPLENWYGWGENIYAPTDGTVIVARDGLKERQRLRLISDLSVVIKNALFFNPEKRDLHPVLGNHLIIETPDGYAFLAHLQNGSIQVEEGQKVSAGDLLGRVGHSGNSTAPHLHFQMMDSSDLLTAQGIPCAFECYEVHREGAWEEVRNAIPTAEERIKSSENR